MKANKKEEKREKTLKILKIVGSAIGLTLCTAGFVALLTIGVRGCAHQSANTDIQLVNMAEDKLSKRQLVNNESPKTYIYMGAMDFNTIHVPLTNGETHTYNVSGTVYGYPFDSITERGYGTSSPTNMLTFRNSANGENDQVAYINSIYQYSETYIMRSYYYTNGVYTGDNNVPLPVGAEIVLNEEMPANSYWSYLLLGETVMPYADFSVQFNSVINPFGPYGAGYDYFINRELTGAKTLFRGLFTDLNGNYYNGVRFCFLSATGTRFGTAEEYSTYTGTGSQYVGMYFIDLAGNEVFVNGQTFVTATAGSQAGNVVMAKSNYFISSYFQNIHIITLSENSDTYNMGSFDRKTAISTLNNTTGVSGIVSSGTTSISGVFTLLGNAFSTWANIFAINVLPGIPLAIFVFLPLVVMIVLAVVWLFKR